MPQHFQQMSARCENLAQFAGSLAGSYPWGILRFDYDQTAFVSGNLRVLRLEAVMRDGFFVAGGTEIGMDLELNLKEHADAMRGEPLLVHLIVPAQSSMSTKGELARYFSLDGEPVTDETTGQNPVHIPRLKPRLALWAGVRPPARFESLPLMCVAAENDAFQQGRFIAPVLAVDEDSPLGRRCAGTTSLVREKSYVLADQLRTGSLSGSFSKGELDTTELRMKLQSLATGLPGPEGALQSGRAHPFALYLLMCQLAGHVAGVTAGLVPPHFPPYDHGDLEGTFQPVLSFIEAAVAEAVVDSWHAIPFRIVDGNFEAPPGRILDEAIRRGGTLKSPVMAIALRGAAGALEDAITRWGQEAVIGTSSIVPGLLTTRVPGAARARVDQLPGLPPPRGTVLFALAADALTAKPGEALQLVERFSNEGRPAAVVLYIRRVPEEKTAG